MPSEERETTGATEHRDTAVRAVVFTLASLAAWWCWTGAASADEATPSTPVESSVPEASTAPDAVDLVDAAGAVGASDVTPDVASDAASSVVALPDTVAAPDATATPAAPAAAVDPDVPEPASNGRPPVADVTVGTVGADQGTAAGDPGMVVGAPAPSATAAAPATAPASAGPAPTSTGIPVATEPVAVASAPSTPVPTPTPTGPTTTTVQGLPQAQDYIRSLTFLLQPVAEGLANLLKPISPLTTPLLENALVPVGPVLSVVLPLVDQVVVPLLEPVLGPVLGGAAPGGQAPVLAPEPSPEPSAEVESAPATPMSDAVDPRVAPAGAGDLLALAASSDLDRGVGTVSRPVSGPLFAETRPPTVPDASLFGVDLRPVPRRAGTPARGPRVASDESALRLATSTRREVTTFRVMDGAAGPLTQLMTVDSSSRAPAPLASPVPPAAAAPDGIPASGATTSVMARTADAGPPSHRVVGVAASSARAAQAWVTAALKSSALVVPQALVANRPPVTPD